MKNYPALSPSASDSRLFDAQRSRGIPRLSWWRRSRPGGRSSSGADEASISDEPLAANLPAASAEPGAGSVSGASAPTEPAAAARNGAARFGATSRTILGAARARSVRVGALAGWRISAVLLLVAFAALLALPAQAQTAGTLVSNLEQTDTSGSTSQLAQAFDTGSNAAGYGLTSVTLRLAGAEQNPGRGALVRITPATSSGPDLSDSTKIITLTTPTLTTDADNVFTAPAGATLDADSTYMVVVTSADGTDGNRFPVGRTRSTGTDSDSDPEWDIADTRFFRDDNTDTWSTSSTLLQFKISGTASVGPTEVPSDWSLIPTGLTTGDQFRLIFLSSTKRDGEATDIATYNSFIQTRAAAGHTDS